MINKQGLWFITLFSLILILAIYYVTVKDNDLLALTTNEEETTEATIETEEVSIITSLKVADEEETLKEMESLQTILLDDTATLEEKNDAYNNLQNLNVTKGEEETLEKKIMNNYNLDSFVKIKNNQIEVTIDSKEHNTTLANNIIRLVQEEYDTNMYIVVKFQTS